MPACVYANRLCVCKYSFHSHTAASLLLPSPLKKTLPPIDHPKIYMSGLRRSPQGLEEAEARTIAGTEGGRWKAEAVLSPGEEVAVPSGWGGCREVSTEVQFRR